MDLSGDTGQQIGYWVVISGVMAQCKLERSVDTASVFAVASMLILWVMTPCVLVGG
jgi:hypothetical protein